jgi:hypothetical protein
MCVFTYPSLHTFSGQPSNVGVLCHTQMTAMQMPVPCSQHSNSISNKAAYWADQNNTYPSARIGEFLRLSEQLPFFFFFFLLTVLSHGEQQSNQRIGVELLRWWVASQSDWEWISNTSLQALLSRKLQKIWNSSKANIKTKFRSNIVDVTSCSKHKMKV